MRSPGRLTRRAFLAGAAALAAKRSTAQSVPTVAWLSIYPLEQVDRYLKAFKAGLAAQGFLDGRHVHVLARSSEGDRNERLAAVVAEVVAAKPAVIATQGGAIYGVRDITTIPVVYGFSGDPVIAGLTSAMAQPGRNLTGVTFMAAELNTKRLELLHEAGPQVKRVVLMGDPMHPGYELEVLTSERTARGLGLQLDWMPARTLADVRQVIASFDTPPDALIFLPDSVMLESRKLIAEYAIANRMPSVSGWTEFAQAGGLMSYGPNLTDSVQRVGYLTARILQGAKPADLPVERPESFELVVNLRTARSIGLGIPTALLAQADEVIE
ncbi:ABC transporter substrate-binding protein [Microvirga massiliensis]|uniref:ABC transporter substrate-binding protein n=1 Tax=Microvirga massiliensis TaxID=1033741 RepID=UPI00062B838A|nr:ABC transporter substrate-binding protein [Microvirga massiliensis]